MKQRIFLLLILLALLEAGYTQKLAPVKGQKLELISTTKMNMDVMGGALVNESVSTTEVEVKDITADHYLFSNTVRHMTLKSSGMGQDISFDSDNKDDMNGEVGQSIKSKIGTAEEVQVDKRGKVIGTKGLDSLKDNKGGMADILNMTNQLTKGAPYPLLIQLPNKAVKQGDTWTDSTGTAATFQSVTVYTLKSVGPEGVSVSFTGTVVANTTMEQNGMEVKMNLTGDTKGESLFEASTGVMKSSTSTLGMKGSLGVAGTDVPMSTTMTATLVTKKL